MNGLNDAEKIAAKLAVFVEGIADHKMSLDSQRLLGLEIVEDLMDLLAVGVTGEATK